MGKEFQFTPENIIENIEKVGAWSSYGLAGTALKHYFPDEYDEEGYCEVERENELLHSLDCNYWHDLIIKFQKEVGYNAHNGFSKEYVNEY